MKKNKVMLAVAVALTVAMVGTGCGAKNDDTVATQKETTVGTKDKKAADKKDTKEIAKENTDKQEQTQQQETAVNAEQEVVAQQAVAADNSTVDTKGSSNNEANNTNTANRPSANTTSTSGNGHVTNTNAGSNPVPNTNNSGGNTSGNPTPAPTPTPTQHQHTWVHVDATGHNETVVVQAAWDEQVPVYEEKARSICNQCGADITDCCDEHMEAGMLAGTCWGWHVDYIRVQTGTKTVHHDAVTEQRWVQDTPAYEQCSGCGATK